MERYKELKVLGKGSFGRAVLAQEKSTGIKYVMKVIHIAPLKPREREEALTEAKILSKLKHPYIVGYHESFADTRYLHIVMEYADAGDLTDAIKRQKMKNSLFPEDQIWDWFVQICMALKHVHDRKILHRDLKTQNIFLCTDENDKSRKTVKLGDFGIAKILQSTLECARTAIGTPYYLSPELCEDKPYNNKSDIWSLGCVLYEICTLQHAFEAQNMKGLVVKILRGQYQPISSTYSRNLKEVIDRMLQKDPNKRPSVNQILKLPFLQDRIKRLLPEDYWNEEFSHTIIHGRGNALVGFGAGRVGIPGKPVSGVPLKDDTSSDASSAGKQPISRNGASSAHPPPPPSQQNKPMYFNPNGGYQPPAANQKLSAAEVAAMAVKNNQRPPPPSQYQSNVKQPGIMPGAIAVGVPGAPPVVQVNNKLSYDEIVRQEKQRIEEQRRRYQEEQARAQEKVRQDFIRQQAAQQNRGYQAAQGNPFAKKPMQQASVVSGAGNAPSADVLDAKFADLQDFMNKPIVGQQPPQVSRQLPAPGISPTRQQQQQQRDQAMRRNIEEQRRHQQEVKRQLAPAPLKEQAKDARERELMEAHSKVQKQKEEQERRIREAKERQKAEWEKKNRDYERQMEEKRKAAQAAEEREKERLFRAPNGAPNASSEANPPKGGMESLLPPKVMDPGVQNRNDPRNYEERTEQQRKLEEQRDAMRKMIAERRREQELKREEQRSRQSANNSRETSESKGRRLCEVPSTQPEKPAQQAAQLDDRNALACLDEKDSDSDFEDPYFNPNVADGNGGPGSLDKAEKAANMIKMLRAETTEESISQRMERLRILLESELGLTNFVKAYQYIRTSTEQGGDDDLNQNIIVGIIGETNVGFINTIVSLIYCEDRFNTTR